MKIYKSIDGEGIFDRIRLRNDLHLRRMIDSHQQVALLSQTQELEVNYFESSEEVFTKTNALI